MTDLRPVSLEQAFASFDDRWSPKRADDINVFRIKLVKLEGAFPWDHHAEEDVVHRGRLRMHFRDAPVDLESGEFLVVPHGVEPMPEALTDPCEVILLEPGTTLNPGNVVNERTVRSLDCLDSG